MRFAFVLTCATLAIGFARTSAAVGDQRCTAIEKVEAISKADRKRIVFTPRAFKLADCTRRDSDLDALLQSPVLDWWVFHTPDEDIRPLALLAERNRALLDKYMSAKATGPVEYSFWGTDLLTILKAFAYDCTLIFRVSGTSHVEVAAEQKFQDAGRTFCLGLAVILAVHGISLDQDGDVIVLPLPK